MANRPKGRRALPEQRLNALIVRFTDTERRRIEQGAAYHGLSAAAWIRMIMLREIRAQQTEQT